MHEIYINNKKVTKHVSNLSWSSNEDTLSVQMNFNIAYVLNTKKYPIEPAHPGDIVTMWNNGKKIFSGIIVTVQKDGYSPRQVTCFDFGFYLNKSQGIIQFNNVTADEAIKRLITKFGFGSISLSIVKIPTKITKIYKSKVISEIITDILEIAETQLGVKYRIEMRGTTLFIEKQSTLTVNANTKHIMNPKRSVTIDEMKNSIQIVSNGEDTTKILASVKDSNSVKKYGLLQMVHEISDEEIPKAKTIANQLFKEYNRIFEENSIELIGDDSVRAGRILKIVEPITGINGTYRIKSVTHKVSGGVHLMSLDLGVI